MSCHLLPIVSIYTEPVQGNDSSALLYLPAGGTLSIHFLTIAYSLFMSLFRSLCVLWTSVIQVFHPDIASFVLSSPVLLILCIDSSPYLAYFIWLLHCVCRRVAFDVPKPITFSAFVESSWTFRCCASCPIGFMCHILIDLSVRRNMHNIHVNSYYYECHLQYPNSDHSIVVIHGCPKWFFNGTYLSLIKVNSTRHTVHIRLSSTNRIL